jgi:hypothetical protein
VDPFCAAQAQVLGGADRHEEHAERDDPKEGSLDLCIHDRRRIRLSPLTHDGYPGLSGADLRRDGEAERHGVFANQDGGP